MPHQGFSHVGLSTLDLDKTREFHEKVLGFAPVRCDIIKIKEGGAGPAPSRPRECRRRGRRRRGIARSPRSRWLRPRTRRSRRYSWPDGHGGWLIPVTHKHGRRAGHMAFVGGQVDKDTRVLVLHPYDLPAQIAVVIAHIWAPRTLDSA